MPAVIRRPLFVVSLVSVVLGMGSLALVHIPAWLSPFDLLRPLPGFRSIDATGRFWGFLALPLSLMGAAALVRVCGQIGGGWRLHAMLGAVVVLQLGFQGETLSSHWLHSPHYRDMDARDYFETPAAIDYVTLNQRRQQGEVLTPARGVCDCYDMDDFVRPRIKPDAGPVLSAAWVADRARRVPSLDVKFVSWSRMEIRADCGPGSVCGGDEVRIVLAQAFHSDWNAPGCEVYGTPDGNLALQCPSQRLREPLFVEYRNSVSDWAVRVSEHAWTAWLCALASLVMVLGWRAAGRQPMPASDVATDRAIQ